MPKIACPTCSKVYNIPDQMVGQVATCKCGNKFRLGKRKSTASTSPAASVPEPTKTHDSFWDDAFDEPVNSPGMADEASIDESESPQAFKLNKKSKSKKKSKQPWQVAVNVLFQLACFGLIAVAAVTAYRMTWTAFESSKEGPEKSAWMVTALVTGCVSPLMLWLAYRGIRLDAESIGIRIAGLGYIFLGILTFAVFAGISIAVTVAWEGGFLLMKGGIAIGAAIGIGGLLQTITGQDYVGEYLTDKEKLRG